MNVKPFSVLYSMAEYYHRDASDFASRFDVLWENQTHKSGRIKSFVDLFIGCECVLKSHIILGKLSDDPEDVYSLIRKAGHKIKTLANLACYQEDRSSYDFIGERLGVFSIFIRYSLDANEIFFPIHIERRDTKINYNETIGNNSWVLEVRAILDGLLDSSKDRFIGSLAQEIEEILEAEKKIGNLVNSFYK
jgi:hypothetical protein